MSAQPNRFGSAHRAAGALGVARQRHNQSEVNKNTPLLECLTNRDTGF
jgi:hypothetical protein